MNERHIAVLINPRAGKGKLFQTINRLRHKLSDVKILSRFFADEWPSDLDGFTDIFLVGGDGTLNFLINKYQSINIPITLFKGGSGNDFAWKLYGKMSFDQLWKVAMGGAIIKIDAGICNNMYFINGVGIGFDGQVVHAMGSHKIISAGYFSYLFTVLREIFFFKEFKMNLKSRIERKSGKIFMISVANGSRYGGGFLVAPNAIINDAEFDVVIINSMSLFNRMRYLPVAKKGAHLQLPFVDSFRCAALEIRTEKAIPAHLDGELLVSNLFTINLLPEKYFFRVRQ